MDPQEGEGHEPAHDAGRESENGRDMLELGD